MAISEAHADVPQQRSSNSEAAKSGRTFIVSGIVNGWNRKAEYCYAWMMPFLERRDTAMRHACVAAEVQPPVAKPGYNVMPPST